MRTVPVRLDEEEMPLFDLAADWKDNPLSVIDSVNEALKEKGIAFEFVIHDTLNDTSTFDLVPVK